MSTHISKIVAGCFATLRQLHSIRRLLTQATLTGLVVSLVMTLVDYCNSVQSGLPLSQFNRLQSVVNAAARLILSGRRCDHITPLLEQLHWSLRELNTSCVYWYIAAYTIWCRITWPTTFNVCPMSRLGDICVRRQHRN